MYVIIFQCIDQNRRGNRSLIDDEVAVQQIEGSMREVVKCELNLLILGILYQSHENRPPHYVMYLPSGL